ncbi:DUF3099 domain-containing protein [Nesterenkonia sp. F]|uniref:DUF3099 domain-containing protein n=1 Tax=Nesterenkonia sp. F TaxID=795955 RepID=UPI000255D11C|nr:DUF3099 domain-containing protein [Nesterenkonia sp. F]
MTEPVHSLTDAPLRHSEEQHGRMVRYAISMGIRLVCFLAAVVVQNWMSWVFLAAAAVLPYIAVTVANAGTDRYQHHRTAGDVEPVAGLEPGRRQVAAGAAQEVPTERDAGDEPDETAAGAEEAPAEGGTIIPGEIVADDETGDETADETGEGREDGSAQFPGRGRTAGS